MSQRVLLFRAPSDDGSKGVDPYEELLGRNGFNVISVPVLEFQFVNADKLAEKLSLPNSYSGLVFSSPRSVDAVNLCCEGHNVDISPWTKLLTYVVGEATEQLVLKKLHLYSRGQACGNAAALAQFIIDDNLLSRDKPLLFPSADIKRDTLPSLLKMADIPIDSLTVYKTKIRTDLASSLQDILDSNITQPEALVFFSPSGVGAVFDALHTLSIPLTQYKKVCNVIQAFGEM